MINLHDCIELGHLTRPHGIKGHITLKLNGFSFDEIEEMERVYIMVDGLPVPFFIEEFTEKNIDTLLIKFEDIDMEPEAKKYSGSQVYIDRYVVTPPEEGRLNANMLKGYSVIDNVKGEIGTVDTLIEYSNNPVLRIIQNRKEILVPYQEEFFESIDDDKKEIHTNCPEGLLDIYLEDEFGI